MAAGDDFEGFVDKRSKEPSVSPDLEGVSQQQFDAWLDTRRVRRLIEFVEKGPVEDGESNNEL